jgi:hypothetical protein
MAGLKYGMVVLVVLLVQPGATSYQGFDCGQGEGRRLAAAASCLPGRAVAACVLSRACAFVPSMRSSAIPGTPTCRLKLTALPFSLLQDLPSWHCRIISTATQTPSWSVSGTCTFLYATVPSRLTLRRAPHLAPARASVYLPM